MGDADTPLRIVVTDPCRLFREALEAALDCEPDFEVVSEDRLGDVPALITEESGVDVVILSVGEEVQDGVRQSCQIKQRVPGCSVIALADSEDQRLLAGNLGCGASAYLLRDSALDELVEAVRAVARGETLVPPKMLGPLLSDLIGRREEHERAMLRIAELSPREREVLAHLARGAKTDAIAECLVISPETARTHIQHILTKLGVHSRLEAAAFVIEGGLLDHLNGGSLPDVLVRTTKKR